MPEADHVWPKKLYLVNNPVPNEGTWWNITDARRRTQNVSRMNSNFGSRFVVVIHTKPRTHPMKKPGIPAHVAMETTSNDDILEDVQCMLDSKNKMLHKNVWINVKGILCPCVWRACQCMCVGDCMMICGVICLFYLHSKVCQLKWVTRPKGISVRLLVSPNLIDWPRLNEWLGHFTFRLGILR